MSEVTVKKYVVRLSKNERSVLEDLISKGKHPAATILTRLIHEHSRDSLADVV